LLHIHQYGFSSKTDDYCIANVNIRSYTEAYCDDL
jgi:hypothetical protein